MIQHINKATLTTSGNYIVFSYKDSEGTPTGFEQAAPKGSTFAWVEDITGSDITIVVQHEGSNIYLGLLSDIAIKDGAVTSLSQLVAYL